MFSFLSYFCFLQLLVISLNAESNNAENNDNAESNDDSSGEASGMQPSYFNSTKTLNAPQFDWGKPKHPRPPKPQSPPPRPPKPQSPPPRPPSGTPHRPPPKDPPHMRDHYRQMCAQAAKFFPNLCDYRLARMHCTDICKENNKQSYNQNYYLDCGKRDPMKPSDWEEKKAKKKNKKKEKAKKNRKNESTRKDEVKHENSHKRIVGGHIAEQGEWPWALYLSSTDKVPRENQTACGGAILTEYFILTAAHCTNKGRTEANMWHVWVGNHDSTKWERFEKRHNVKRVIIKDNYNSATKSSDLAIFELQNPISMRDPNKGRICLPDDNDPVSIGKTCYIYGWGFVSSETRKNSAKLKHAKVKIFAQDECRKGRARRIDDTMLCAGNRFGETDSCRGDSGGSLSCYMSRSNRWSTVGVTSFGPKKCGSPGILGVYSDTAAQKEWILKAILEKTEYL